MGMFDFFKSAAEKKRDDYDDLHDSIKDAIKEHDNYMEKISDAINSYNKLMPSFKKGVPSDPFRAKEDDVIQNLKKVIRDIREKRAILTAARDIAYRKYLEYKQKAIAEKAAEERERKKEREELMKKLTGGSRT